MRLNNRNLGVVTAGAALLAMTVLVLFIARLTGATDGENLSETGSPPKVSVQVVAGSTAKVEQLIGDLDAQTKQPTTNRTESRFGIKGTDLGTSFEYRGHSVFLFGDTIGPNGGDAIAYSASTEPDAPLILDFLVGGDGQYLRVQPPEVPMGGYAVPVGGIEVNGAMYVAVKTSVARDWATDTTLLTRYDDATQNFRLVRQVSRLPDGHFITLSMRMAPEGLPGLPTNEPYVLMFGSGEYRKSKAYLAAVPAATFETGAGTVYYAGRDGKGPVWTAKESDASPIIDQPTLGDISMTFVPQFGLWLALYDSRSPQGIIMRYATEPWGPWSSPQLLVDLKTSDGTLMHDPRRKPDDGLAGPVNAEGRRAEEVAGGYYAPYVIDRFTSVEGQAITLHYVLSTWNPYVVVRMKSTIQVIPNPPG
jgi:hypothetical protein